MDAVQIISILLAIGFFLLSLLSSGARAALSNASPTKLIALGEQSGTGYRRVIDLLTIPALTRSRASLHFALVFSRLILAGLAAIVVQPWNDPPLFLLWMALLYISLALVISITEWVVEARVAVVPEIWMLRLAPFVRMLNQVFLPLNSLALGIASRPAAADVGTSSAIEEELKSLMDAGQQGGVLEKEESEMIYSIFRLGNTLAREIMIPRTDVTALEITTPVEEVLKLLLKTGYSRLPVYEETIDNILGVLYSKDLLRVWQQGYQIDSLKGMLREAYFVPEAKKVDELLAEMQTRRVHMAIIVDEYGGVAGVVTLEDIVEEIVGEIQDEFDQAEELPYTEVSPGNFIFQGRIDLDAFNALMETNLAQQEADSLGGYIYNQIGRVPNSGESIQVDNILLTVEQVIGRRIRKVRAQKLPPASDNGEESYGAIS